MARLGAEIRARRVAQNMTLEALAKLIGWSAQHVSQAELAQTTVSEEFVEACDRALDARGGLLAMYPEVVKEYVVERQRRSSQGRRALRSSQEVDDVKRRAFIGLGLSVVLLGPEAAARASHDDWDRIAHAWSYEILTAPDRSVLLPGLAADLKRLQANGGPQRVVAQLSSYVGAIAISSGDPALARRWWKRARTSAAASGDNHLAAYVTGNQAVSGLYGAYSPGQAVVLAEQALNITSAPCTGRMQALGAKAQALAMLGRKKAASETLVALERTFERLPRDITREKLSALGWPEERLHHTRSYCGMYGIAPAAGATAREQALRLYADADWRGRALVTLHGAASETDARDAVATLTKLSEAQRSDRFVRTIAGQALVACETSGADVAELREVLA